MVMNVLGENFGSFYTDHQVQAVSSVLTV